MNNKDGYELWMAYDPLGPSTAVKYKELLQNIIVAANDPLCSSAASELSTALQKLLGEKIPLKTDQNELPRKSGQLIIGTYTDIEKIVPGFAPVTGDRVQNEEGFHILTTEDGIICITGESGKGVLYGTFAFIRLMQSGKIYDGKTIISEPKLSYRMLNHWDNLDGSIERGYAGETLWKWAELPGKVDNRYTDYARACASIGINASVLNNVNTQPEILSTEYLKKVAAIAETLRKWGITTFLSVNFASPKTLGGLETADPLDERVRQWWKEKIDEVYAIMPDFGGFLMKADSEGEPGPYQYGRSHAEGANMFGEALKPHNGVIIWRAFVYGHGEDDRAKKAYSDFKPLDGKFLPNVAVQVKNGPIDFQPREPISPMFGAMDSTNLFMEFQIAQEYLGQGNHIVYLGPMWKEILDFDTKANGDGSTVGKILTHDIHSNGFTGIAAVTNTGNNPDWCGSHFHPLNWYAYGRLTWDYELDTTEIAQEWIYQTFGQDTELHQIILSMLTGSWEACVDYMTPLGLHHIMKEHHHYGPDPGFDGGEREDWRCTYYHRADAKGLGFDRTRNGSSAVDQYHKAVADIFNDIEQCPEKYLLWFHHVPWTKVLSSGRTLKDELVFRYRRGVKQVEQMRDTWISVKEKIDTQRYNEVLEKLTIQMNDAKEWEKVCTEYFLNFANAK